MARHFHKAASVYARTLLEHAASQGSVEGVRDDFIALERAFSANPSLVRALTLAGLSEEKRALIVRPISEKATETVRRLLALLETKGRLALFPDIVAAFLRLDEDARNIRRARIVSAKPMTAEQLGTLSGILSTIRAGAEFTLRNEVDESLIAGFRIEEEGFVTDASLRNKLDGIRQRLAAA
jgi:F-type H+-transporting ATPase subunit delta